MIEILTAAQAIEKYVHSGQTLAVEGFIGLMKAEELLIALRNRFLETGAPSGLTVVHCAGQGNRLDNGMNHLAVDGLIDRIIAGHFAMAPQIGQMILDEKIAGFNLPQGVIAHLFRDIAAGKPGTLTHVGLGTFADPEIDGCRLNKKAYQYESVVEKVDILGQTKLLYKSFPIDVCFLRATWADTRGNCSLEREPVTLESTAIAQATRNSGGKVIVQVSDIVEYGSLNPQNVRIPGIYVDAIVKAAPDNHWLSNTTVYSAGLTGEKRIPVAALPALPMSERKIIARRALQELQPGMVTNLGIGMPEGIAAEAAELGISDLTMTTESGTIGGYPASDGDFGAALNPDCILTQPEQFDFYDGGGLDIAFLGLAQVDRHGNINVSKFGPKLAGCGGFINITQNAKTVVFCGTFTAGGLQTDVENGRLIIKREGSVKKFVHDVEQITFSGRYAVQTGQRVLYITERAVFVLTKEGLELIEITPGVSLEKDILSQMSFKPVVRNVASRTSVL